MPFELGYFKISDACEKRVKDYNYLWGSAVQMKTFFGITLTIFFLLGTSCLSAQQLVVDEETTKIDLTGSLRLVPTTTYFSLSDSIQIQSANRVNQGRFLDHDKNYYGILNLRNNSKSVNSFVLSFGNIDSVLLTYYNGSGIINQKVSGTQVAYKSKAMSAGGWEENFIDVQLLPNQQINIFIEIKSTGTARQTFHPKLLSNEIFLESRATEQFVQGVFQGIMLIICTFAFILYVARKRVVHLYYALFVFCLYFTFLVPFGYTKEITGSYDNDVMLWTFFGQIAAYLCVQFFRYALSTPGKYIRLDTILLYLSYGRIFTISLGVLQLILSLNVFWLRSAIVIVDILSIVAAFYILVMLLKNNDLFIKYILYSTIVLIAGLGLTIVSTLLGFDVEHNHFLQASVVGQNLILSLGLGFLVKSRFEQEIAKRQEDITQQMQINYQLEQQVHLRTRALENQKDFIQKIIDEMPNHVFVRNSQGNYKIVNRAFAEYYGKKKEDFIGKSILETHSDIAQAQKYLKEDQMVLSQDMKVSDEYLLDPQTGRWVYFYKVPFKLGRKSYVLCMEIDITEIKRASNQLKQTNKELNKAIDHLHQAQSEIIQKEKMAVLGRLSAGIAHEINTPLGVIRGSVDYLIESFGDIGDIIQVIYEKVPEEYRETILSNVKNAAETYRFLTSSEERRMVKELSEKLAAEGVENANHLSELSLHLDVERDFEQLLPIWKLEHSEEIFEAIQLLFFRFNSIFNIKNAMEKANKILFAIKSYTHFKNEGLFKPVDLRDNVENVLIMFENILKAGVDVEFDVPKGATIYGLPDELGQVWTNLISNAIHAMDKKGTLKIYCQDYEEYYVIAVEDNGSGIPIEMQHKIFEPFFTTKSAGHGSGLGLDIIKRIVEKHNGHISFKSEPGKTVFYVRLNRELNPVAVEP